MGSASLGGARTASQAATREWTELCARARVAPDVHWSARFLYSRLWRSGKYVEESIVQRVVRERLQAHVCAEVTLHGRRPCAKGTAHEGCCPGQC